MITPVSSSSLLLLPLFTTNPVHNAPICKVLSVHSGHNRFTINTPSKEQAKARKNTLWLLTVLSFFYFTSASPAQTSTSPQAIPALKDTPRLMSGHPCTLWDKQDVAIYKAAFTNNPNFKAAFEELKTWGNKRITEPLNVPVHQQETNGSWTFPAYMRGYQNAVGEWKWEWNFNGTLQHLTEDVSNLGELYALTDDEKYAIFAKQILLALVDAYGNGKGNSMPDTNGYDHFGAYGFDGGDAGMFLAKACQSYDLIYNMPSLSAEDRTHIELDLIRPMAEHLEKSTFMYTDHGRWGMVCLYGVFIAGVTLNDQAMEDLALYGQGGTREHLTGGFMDCFKPACLRDGVVWGADTKIEEQMAALCVLTTVAEVMWHRDVDLYGYQDKAMKKSFDAALKTVGDGELSKFLALPGIDAYQYGFLRYQEPRYQLVIGKLNPGFMLAIGERLPTPAKMAATIK